MIRAILIVTMALATAGAGLAWQDIQNVYCPRCFGPELCPAVVCDRLDKIVDGGLIPFLVILLVSGVGLWLTGRWHTFRQKAWGTSGFLVGSAGLGYLTHLLLAMF